MFIMQKFIHCLLLLVWLVKRGDTGSNRDAEILTGNFSLLVPGFNRLRSLHQDTPLLEYNYIVQSEAEFDACRLAGTPETNHIGGDLIHRFRAPVTGILPQDVLFKTWYHDGLTVYDWKTSGYQLNTSDFTQLVWASSRRVGCGLVEYPVPKSNMSKTSQTMVNEIRERVKEETMKVKEETMNAIFVCHFSPHGNVGKAEAFKANVKPLKPSS